MPGDMSLTPVSSMYSTDYQYRYGGDCISSLVQGYFFKVDLVSLRNHKQLENKLNSTLDIFFSLLDVLQHRLGS